jgi:hypothetical protein
MKDSFSSDRTSGTGDAWQPIETAPKDGTPVYVMNDKHPTWGSHLLCWSAKGKRWEGYAFAPLGPTRTFWDEALDQPTHWRQPTPGSQADTDRPRSDEKNLPGGTT